MDDRYRDSHVTALWSRQWTYNAWWQVERAVARAQIEQCGKDPDKQERAEQTKPLLAVHPDFDDPWTLTGLAAYEAEDRHDVAAFVRFMRDWYGEPHGRWIHYGLTSSDIVDTAQGMRFRSLGPRAWRLACNLRQAVDRWVKSEQMVVGRTHGEPAEPISMGMRASHWNALLSPALERLQGAIGEMQVAKTSGPVGNYAHNGPWVESKVAIELGLVSCGQGASQIAPRDRLAHWATDAAQVVSACAKIAMDIRLMLLLGEGKLVHPAGQVGSSSMAHKTNPIRAEQITGMQRLAAAYAASLQPLDLWLERDISNSCVERVAVPDLWHVLFHVERETVKLLESFELGRGAELALHEHESELSVHKVTLEAISSGMDAKAAREHALMQCLLHPIVTDRQPTDPTWYLRHWAKP
jgi:adenylosuccinate lyase